MYSSSSSECECECESESECECESESECECDDQVSVSGAADDDAAAVACTIRATGQAACTLVQCVVSHWCARWTRWYGASVVRDDWDGSRRSAARIPDASAE